MIILGIDPGSSRIGYGVIEKKPGNIRLIKAGVIEIKTKKTSLKYATLASELENLLKKCRPDIAAIEKLYFSKNQKTAMEVAGAIGVIMYVISKSGVPLREYAPQQIKKAITGFGSADKATVAKMSCALLNIKDIPGPDDVSDAVAIAITAAHHNQTLTPPLKST
ncbi:crossover junction endodeoxyribonuclease RuvC [Candidatus Wolfebacteria bacterium RIFCSPLOWO2_01_FULL_45_19]|uniref:Crossover junction endodeoxyribonuclease RuvC n=1 Tax=Candidatus Wolfebacteria bacterium RIFCSPLOWO2_01_FULL_45_19 TaxID=1802557 RepID=A0A1F8DTY0_9BACT|nr:MAG: Crossover junction endodeoxyribonuclease RuvC [Parcubacteria group bacterium GW2011_GWB1_45_9]OGM91449.1 MAG: crossover junction endodeoxyribonuclease RuvC [Candidatus Wolfebacteria bacterium RIFCSPLOWO2_01_FULL_45_19]